MWVELYYNPLICIFIDNYLTFVHTWLSKPYNATFLKLRWILTGLSEPCFSSMPGMLSGWIDTRLIPGWPDRIKDEYCSLPIVFFIVVVASNYLPCGNVWMATLATFLMHSVSPIRHLIISAARRKIGISSLNFQIERIIISANIQIANTKTLLEKLIFLFSILVLPIFFSTTTKKRNLN